MLDLVPRQSAPIVVYDDGEGFAEPAAARLRELGYTNVSVLDGGLSGWIAVGGEVYRDASVPDDVYKPPTKARTTTPPCGAISTGSWV